MELYGVLVQKSGDHQLRDTKLECLHRRFSKVQWIRIFVPSRIFFCSIGVSNQFSSEIFFFFGGVSLEPFGVFRAGNVTRGDGVWKIDGWRPSHW